MARTSLILLRIHSAEYFGSLYWQVYKHRCLDGGGEWSRFTITIDRCLTTRSSGSATGTRSWFVLRLRSLGSWWNDAKGSTRPPYDNPESKESSLHALRLLRHLLARLVCTNSSCTVVGWEFPLSPYCAFGEQCRLQSTLKQNGNN